MSSDESTPLLPTERQDVERQECAVSAWREKTGYVLESKALHLTVIFLIVLDAGCSLADLSYTLLTPGCTPPETGAPLWLDFLSHVSFAITTLFLVEIPLSLWAFGWNYYNPFGRYTHAVFHFFDALIITVTFVLEAILRGKELELASLLIFLRLWRLVKLVGGVAVGAGEIDEPDQKELDEAKEELRALKEENISLRQQLSRYESNE
ncbi:hypothetical protein BD626DRAFT_405162 [Schizophyllum amplum]|uniref:Voltage-gated hydrogen channel 1 n=1 Tax=Schizophyllum amplum TaxID=97359 RepID=A0A550CB20_9AGAR|nr:hypothetical protein BD626DRAFT_405162 [Auriculariopsis ampla]